MTGESESIGFVDIAPPERSLGAANLQFTSSTDSTQLPGATLDERLCK